MPVQRLSICNVLDFAVLLHGSILSMPVHWLRKCNSMKDVDTSNRA